MADFEEMNGAMRRAGDPTPSYERLKTMYDEVSKRLTRLQAEHWALKDELTSIMYHIKRLARGDYER